MCQLEVSAQVKAALINIFMWTLGEINMHEMLLEVMNPQWIFTRHNGSMVLFQLIVLVFSVQIILFWEKKLKKLYKPHLWTRVTLEPSQIRVRNLMTDLILDSTESKKEYQLDLDQYHLWLKNDLKILNIFPQAQSSY